MFWLEKLMHDNDIKTRYALSKKTNIRESTLSNIISRQTSLNNMRFSVIIKLVNGLDITFEELNEKYNENEV